MDNKFAALAAVLALFAGSAVAAETGELWESSMNIPGMPAGMGARKVQVCRDKNEPATDRNDCKISNLKRSGLTESMTISCPDSGDMTMETTYNATRTEYTSVMHMKGRRAGEEMTFKTSGKKIGTCDPAQARAARDKQNKAALAQADKQKADMADMYKKENEKTAAACAAALESMQPRQLLQQKKDAAQLAQVKDPNYKNPLAAGMAKCKEDGVEFCKRFKTEAGFLKTRRDERNEAGQLCEVSPSKLRASLCATAVKSEDFTFAGAECLPESAGLGDKYCGGMDFTAVVTNPRTGKFCRRYLAYKQNKQEEDAARASEEAAEKDVSTTSGRAQPGSVSRTSATPSAGDAAAKAAGQTTDAATEAVNQGLNKLKGLFGR